MSDHIIDPSFEDLVRSALTDTVSGASPASLPARVRRRARVRQVVTASATGLGVIAIVFAAFSFAGSMFGEPPKVTVGGREMDARGAGGISPCHNDPFGSMPGGGGPDHAFCVAHGSYEGVSWSLGASVHNDDLCLATATMGGGAAAGIGSSCDDFEDGGIGMSVSQIEGYPKHAVGYVPGATQKLFLEHGRDESFELQVYPTPKGFPLDLKFYSVFMPDDAQTFVAYDADGNEIARRNVDGEPGAPGEQTERTRSVNVDKGAYSGISWVLDTFGTVIDGRETVCTAFAMTDDPAEGIKGKLENETCHIGVPDHDVIGIAKLVTEDVPGVVAYSGVMSSKVDSVILMSDEDGEYQVEVIKAPTGIEDRLAYFVLIVKDVDAETFTGTITARSAGGAILAKREV